MSDKPKEEIPFASGISSSKVPRLELLPYEGLIRTAARFELGIERKGEMAWNALSANQGALTDRAFILARIGHLMHHASKLQAKILGTIPDDGEDDAGAIGWSAMFLCAATKALADQKNCSACGGSGEITTAGVGTCKCPARKGSGKFKP